MTYRHPAVHYLGICAAIGLVGVIILAWKGNDAPEGIMTTLAGVFGALAGVVVPRTHTPTDGEEKP